MRKTDTKQKIGALPYPMTEKIKMAVEDIGNKDYSETGALFKGLADPARIKIIEALGVKELCVCVLVDITGLQYAALSYHLRSLKELGLISFRKDGNFFIYSLTPRGKDVHKFIKTSSTRLF
jgi:ArsR family transcriptional regulator, lead/cadmium/zinc/bismuth-responsive transcriptional repressor